MRLGVAAQRHVATAGGAVGQWWTPLPIAQDFAAWLGITSRHHVVDAGAGRGALAVAAMERGAQVSMVERDPHLVHVLRSMTIGHVHDGDFLELDVSGWAPAPSIVVSNPPWEGDLPERFALHALRCAPCVAMIVPLNMLCGKDRGETFWRAGNIRPRRARALAGRPRFLGAKGGMRDVMFVEIERGAPTLTRTGHVALQMEVG